MTFSLAAIAFIYVFSLLGVSIYGLLTSRNLIKVILALQLLAKATIVMLVLASQQSNLGQSLALTVLVADTIVAVVALALAVQVRHHFGSLDVKGLSTLSK